MNAKEFLDLQDAYVEVCEQETGRGPRISDTYDERDAEGGPKGGGTIKGPKKKNVIRIKREEVENWVNSLIEEGYDLSEYTWEEMYEAYENLNEGRTTSLSALSRESQKRKDDKKRGRPETESETHSRLAMGNFRPGASQEERAEGGRQVLKDRGKVPKKSGKDMFEHILEHLVAEGYADTNENALAIMANMSEEWREDILDEANKMEKEYDVPNWDKVYDRNNRDFGPNHTSKPERRPSGKLETPNQTTKRLGKRRKQDHKDTRGVKQIPGAKGIGMQFGRAF